jgi:PAS domain S-box-containing protein
MAPLGLTESSEGLVRALTERVPVGIFVTNAVGECVYGNELVLRLTGQTLEESLGYGWIRALHPEDAEQVQQAWSDAAAGRAEPRRIIGERWRGDDGPTRRRTRRCRRPGGRR